MRLAAGLIALTLLTAPPAGAAIVSIERSSKEDEEILVFKASPQEQNNVSIGVEDGTNVTVTDSAPLFAAGDICVPTANGSMVTCAAESLGGARIALGDGNDRLSVKWDAGAPGVGVVRRCGGSIEYLDGSGNDTIFGSDESEHFVNGRGNDSFRGGRGDDQFDGGRGTDAFLGGIDEDRVCYDDRASRVRVDLDGRADDGASGEGDRVGRDLENITGGRASDRIAGDRGANELIGGRGRDRLRGGRGADVLRGGRGRDRLFGGRGADKLFGGPGLDVFVGGPGNDSFG